jgi:hypothetical protein
LVEDLGRTREDLGAERVRREQAERERDELTIRTRELQEPREPTVQPADSLKREKLRRMLKMRKRAYNLLEEAGGEGSSGLIEPVKDLGNTASFAYTSGTVAVFSGLLNVLQGGTSVYGRGVGAPLSIYSLRKPAESQPSPKTRVSLPVLLS